MRGRIKSTAILNLSKSEFEQSRAGEDDIVDTEQQLDQTVVSPSLQLGVERSVSDSAYDIA